MKHGDLVKLEAFAGEQIIRMVIEVRDGVVLVCKQEEFETALSEKREPTVVGFPLTCVLEELQLNADSV